MPTERRGWQSGASASKRSKSASRSRESPNSLRPRREVSSRKPGQRCSQSGPWAEFRAPDCATWQNETASRAMIPRSVHTRQMRRRKRRHLRRWGQPGTTPATLRAGGSKAPRDKARPSQDGHWVAWAVEWLRLRTMIRAGTAITNGASRTAKDSERSASPGEFEERSSLILVGP